MTEPDTYKDVSAVILAGGKGIRVGGEDKGLLEFRGRPLIEHVISSIAPQVGALLIIANRHIEQYSAYGYPVLTDSKPGYCGPLAGIATALESISTPMLLCVPCDTPLLPSDLVSALYRSLQMSNASIAVASDGDRLHPVISLMRSDRIKTVARRLEAKQFKLHDWLESEEYVVTDFSDRPAVLSNMNTMADIEGLS